MHFYKRKENVYLLFNVNNNYGERGREKELEFGKRSIFSFLFFVPE